MKAIVQDGYGSADVLELRDVDDPAFGPDEVRMRVHAAGCGPDVWHLMTGRPYFVRAMPGFRHLRTGVRGRDAAGVVDAVGSSVTDLAPGDAVMGIVEGSFAELGVGPADELVPKPARLSFEEAAALPISGLTALQAVRDVAAVRPGEHVLVIGAGGGVGTLTVQVAKAFGAEVTALCGADKAELVRSIGADEVLDRARVDVTDGSRRWDAIVDTAGRRALWALRRALAPRGRLAIVGGEGGGRWTGGFGRQIVRAPLWSALGRRRMRAVVSKERLDDLRELARMVDAGTLTPVVGRTYPLVDAPEAIRELERGHARGKIVVSVVSG
jgi:NADPH:quinone reductase-like Zn-dependent oxidoreductase